MRLLPCVLLALALCSQVTSAQIHGTLDRERIRRDFEDLQRKRSNFLIVPAIEPGLVYIAGIEKSTGEYKLLPARFVEMLEAANSLNPQEAATRFETWQFVLRNYPECGVCKLGLRNFAQLLMNTNPKDESSFYEEMRTSEPGDLRRSYIKSIRSAIDTFPIAEKGPFLTQAEAASLNLDDTLILHSCYNPPKRGDNLVCRSFWYRKPSASLTTALKTMNARGDEHIVAYLRDLVFMPQGPYSLEMADQLTDLGHHGVEPTWTVWLDVATKLDNEKRERKEQEEAALRAEELQDRATKLKGYYLCNEGDHLDGATCFVPGTGNYHPDTGVNCALFDISCIVNGPSTPPVSYKAKYIPTTPPTLLPACTAALVAASTDNLGEYRKEYCACLDTSYNAYLSRDEKSVLASDFSPYDPGAVNRDLDLFDHQIEKGKPDSFVAPAKACKATFDLAVKGAGKAKN